MDRSDLAESASRRVLTIDIDASCGRLTNGLGDWALACRSMTEATTRLLRESFDAILVVACGYGSRALSLTHVESIIRAAGSTPVLVILEGDDQPVGHFALECGAFVVLVRGAIGPGEIRRRVALAIEMGPQRGSDALINECLSGNPIPRLPSAMAPPVAGQQTRQLGRSCIETMEA